MLFTVIGFSLVVSSAGWFEVLAGDGRERRNRDQGIYSQYGLGYWRETCLPIVVGCLDVYIDIESVK